MAADSTRKAYQRKISPLPPRFIFPAMVDAIKDTGISEASLWFLKNCILEGEGINKKIEILGEKVYFYAYDQNFFLMS